MLSKLLVSFNFVNFCEKALKVKKWSIINQIEIRFRYSWVTDKDKIVITIEFESEF